MDYQKRLEELEAEKEKILDVMRHCQHDWNDPIYDPEQKEIVDYEEHRQGVDVMWIPIKTGRYKTVDRWSRKCKNCGKIEYSHELRYERVSRGPKFD